MWEWDGPESERLRPRARNNSDEDDDGERGVGDEFVACVAYHIYPTLLAIWWCLFISRCSSRPAALVRFV